MPSDLPGFIPVVLHLPFFKAHELCLRFEKKYLLKYSVLSVHLWRGVILFSLDPQLTGDLIVIASWLYPWLALVKFVTKKIGFILPWDLPCLGGETASSTWWWWGVCSVEELISNWDSGCWELSISSSSLHILNCKSIKNIPPNLCETFGYFLRKKEPIWLV